jgi:DNA-binding SARP family transcriptional activator
MGYEWRIDLFGGLRASRGEQVLTRFRTHKAGALLAYLAYHRQGAHPREVLMGVLWPEDDVSSARQKLSVALSWLRGQLEPPGVADGAVLVADRQTAALNAAAVNTDVAAFETALAGMVNGPGPADAGERAQALEAATALYGGDLLAGYYEDWVLVEQQRLQELLLLATRELVALRLQAGAAGRAFPAALRAASLVPLSEPAHCDLMRLHLTLGQPAEALRRYRELERILREELGSVPGADARALAAAAETGRLGDWQSPAGTAGSASTQASPSPGVFNTPPTLPTPHAPARSAGPESPGGAVPLGSQYYVVRETDAHFVAAIERRESIVLVKGARETGKTSLLARGLQAARETGVRVALTDFSRFNAAQLASAEALLRALAQSLADQLELSGQPGDDWDESRGANPNLWRYLRRVALPEVDGPLVWGLDEVDRLFGTDFGNEVFALFRSWHNERTFDPGGPFGALTLAIAYATEAHLFITDLNQSPFNVGSQFTLHDFDIEQVAELNRRYGEPLTSPGEVAQLVTRVGGHPYLVRRTLHELVARQEGLAWLERKSERLFADHLRRLRELLARNDDLCEAVRRLVCGQKGVDADAFYRLRTAGVLSGDSPRAARVRCGLYETYLRGYLLPSGH